MSHVKRCSRFWLLTLRFDLLRRRNILFTLCLILAVGLLVAGIARNASPLQAQTAKPLMQRLSVAPNGAPGNANSQYSAISADGSTVAFSSTASNLVAEDTAWSDVFAQDLQTGDLGWQTTILDVRGFVGQSADVTLDANGHPHIAYNSDNAGAGELRYAWWDGFVWHSEVVDEGVSTGEYASIAIGINGQPRIAYYHRDDTALKHAQRSADGAWQTVTVDSIQDRGRFASMTIDSVSGVADIVYYERQGTRLLHVRGPVGIWTYREVDDSGDVGEDASLARGPNGLLATAYYDRSNGALKYAQWNQATLSWTPEVVDSAGDTGRFTSIAFDSQGRPHISYLEAGEPGLYNLKYAVRNGAQWTTRTVETNVTLGPTSLVIGPQNLPIVAYRSGGIRLARLKENVWNIETIDNNARNGNSLSLVRDATADREHLVYEDNRYGDLAYATWAEPWQERIVGAGDGPSLVVRHGRPTVLYRRDDANQTLQRVNGLPGPIWGQNSVRTGTGESSNPMILDADGVEHVAFYEPGRRAIVYATPVNGAWQYEDAAILPEGAIFQPNLRLVLSNGEPRVIYTFYTGEVSMHIAYRADGTWQTSTHPSPRGLGTEPNFDALALDSGVVIISYWDADDGDLRLITWNGTLWVDTLVDAGPEGAGVGEFNALARGLDVSGSTMAVEVPAIAYYDRTNQSIRYAYNTGLGWQTTELIPNSGNVTGIDLDVAGDTHALPYIVFTAQDGDLRLAFSNDNLQTVTLETIAEDAATFAAQPSLVHDNQPRIVYRNGKGEIVYTFPTARRSVPALVHNDGLNGSGILYGAGLDLPVCMYFFVLPRFLRTATQEARATATLPDGQVMGLMTERFRQSSGGPRYLALATQHAQEMALIARGDPSLLWDGHRVMQNFMPGLEAWVSGRGDKFTVTQQMVDDARDIWQRIAAQAGPDLSAAINAELAATNNLQNFVGDSFDQWAAEIGVEGSGGGALYLPLVEQ